MSAGLCYPANAQPLFHGFLITHYKLEHADSVYLATDQKNIIQNFAKINAREKTIALLALGQIEMHRKNEAGARRYFYDALEMAREQSDRQLICLSYFKLGAFYYVFGAPPSVAVKHLYTAKKMYKPGTYIEAYMSILRLIGFLEIDIGNNQQAEETYAELMSLINVNDVSPEYNSIYNNIGILFTETGKFEKAADYLNLSYKIRLKLGDSILIAQSLVNLGTLERDRGRQDTALNYYKRAYGIQARNNAKPNALETRMYIGILYEYSQKYSEAIKIFEEIQLLKNSRNNGLSQRLLPHLANSYSATQNYKLAYECLKQLEEVNKALASESERASMIRYKIESELGKKMFEDSILYSQKNLMLKYENEKKLSMIDESKKRDTIIYVFSTILILIIASVVYMVQRQKSRLQIKDSRIKTLQAQMNPHFIFNALNSVMEYIRRSERDNALLYLTKFSRLIRMVLESSQHTSIALAQEIEILRHYVDLENLRFGNSFLTNIAIDESLDLEEIEIPTLIIQPFVENSILHGLRNRLMLSREQNTAYEPRLQIRFSRRDTLLLCVIEDNGAGRKKAAEIKQHNTFANSSLGMRITSERLELLYKKVSKINFTDLFDQNNEPAGTRVEILISLKERF